MTKLFRILAVIALVTSCASKPTLDKDKQVVYQYLYKSLPQLRACWLPYLKKRVVKPADSIALEFDINSRGRVEGLKGKLSSAYLPLRIKKCILHKVVRIQFPKRNEVMSIRTQLAFR